MTQVVSRTSYYDNELPRRVREEDLLDFDGSVWVTIDRRYDGHGRLLSETTIGLRGVDPVTRYHYDPAGNLAAVETPDPTTDSGATVHYSYIRDGLGRMRNFLS